MKTGSDCAVAEIPVSSSNLNPSELRLTLDLDWFDGRDVPGTMVIDLDAASPDACATQVATPTAPGTSVLAGKKVVLDPGHGEIEDGVNDPGAVNRNLGRNERDEVRVQAEMIKKQLESHGAEVHLVENNTGKSLGQIGAEGRGADCFVSLHLNAFNGSAQGHEVFIHRAGTSTDKKLATILNSKLTVLPIRDRGVKSKGLAVLSGVPLPVPAVLTEAFFIDSVPDAPTLTSWNMQAAQAISDGIKEFLTT